jgi:hypothetical protein
MPDLDQRPKVTIEDLLRLKRAERPAAGFWADFERELRQKQLAALLEKRPWWQELPHFLVRRAYIPIGATAILALTLVSVKYYLPAQLAQGEGSAPGLAVAARHKAATTAATLVSVPVSSPLVDRSEPAVQGLGDRAQLAATTVKPLSSTDLIDLMPQLVVPREVETPSARSIAANLARLEQSEPELVNAVMGSRPSSPARVQTASASFDELPSVSTNPPKRNRLLAQYNDRLLSPGPTAPDIVRERLARRLGDSDITDRISRIGLRGDQVSLRF